MAVMLNLNMKKPSFFFGMGNVLNLPLHLMDFKWAGVAVCVRVRVLSGMRLVDTTLMFFLGSSRFYIISLDN